MTESFGIGDVIAVYAAFLSTAVAILQYRQHQLNRQILSIKFDSEFTIVHKSVCCTITNLSNYTVNIECGGVGYVWRPWLRPWKRDFETLCVRPFVLSKSEGWGETYVDVIAAGGAVYLECSDVQKHTPKVNWLNARGFGGRNVVAIEHSASAKLAIAFP
ncbi:MAG: hypothetical protein Q7T68_18230 [Sphingopyxis sp.]|nr:hypothetical protein [Sphingopyxis sp.]